MEHSFLPEILLFKKVEISIFETTPSVYSIKLFNSRTDHKGCCHRNDSIQLREYSQNQCFTEYVVTGSDPYNPVCTYLSLTNS